MKMYKGKVYQRRERWYMTKAVAVLAITAAIGYYGFVYHPCVKHIMVMVNENRVPVLNFIK